MEKVLIIGANGTTGRMIAKRLVSHPSYSPVAMIRDSSQQAFFEKLGVKTVLGDLEKDFSEAFKGIDKVIFAAGSGSKTGKEKTLAVDKLGAIKSMDLAMQQQVKKFVMLSARGVENAEKADESMQHYLMAKKAADEYLKSSSLPFAIVRPGKLTNGPYTGKIKISAVFNEKGEISREDVAAVLVHMLDPAIEGRQIFEILAGKVDIPEAINLFLKSGQPVI
ncbi:SDR family oxidoreductase [Cyclobacterium jeungdonense]|uniref:SDR family oxidoreductase n=1 Tax=Cyclobacterium jeungdonense TaxID=708087 RepID=A0ABT8C339_9BACT|nr:SDR family oxidoreductase [Cyclobacterium jeungdonense]MDN3686459.1 SDR family oxidoreductase [Cyclobacterium jeungdonense]